MNINKELNIGNIKSQFLEKEVLGQQVSLKGETFYKISNVDGMRPFFMSIVSNSNHWMFISSTGALSAGRKNSNYALFPYYTDDIITESSEVTGSKTIIKVKIYQETYLWEPFSEFNRNTYKISRNIYKNSFGDKVIFEEVNHDLNLTFTYEWNSSNTYGFVKKSTLINRSSDSIEVHVLDGLQNILPYGVEEDLQRASSNLVDAYKRNELEADVGLGIYSLSAIIVDKAEPSEALKANIVWSLGNEKPTYLLSSLQVNNFRNGFKIEQEVDVKAERGAYFTSSVFALAPNTENEWLFVTNVNQSITDINQLKETIKSTENLKSLIFEDIENGTENLKSLVGAADGIQLTADNLRGVRHFANTMFNIMRGGIFDNNYQIEKSDFVNYIQNANKEVYKLKSATLNKLPSEFTLFDIKSIAKYDENTDFFRLCFEYLPLKFSRRHGDPSRPWNKFSINTRSEVDGSKILDYQGNWRDIFQNWEALAHSYPEFIEGMIHKFLNATTFDGYNPYRVTKGGFDWETIEPDNPWSYIGYWGDHQIIYLLKFLEFIEKHFPKKLTEYFNKNVFVYANVPYRIKSYQEILQDPKNTIDFDDSSEEEIQKLRNNIGVDGALLRDESNAIYKVNFLEKILATVLAKMSNFIPEAGIWMNTQRPEWNDANNALVGNGVSMVTLYYLRRFLAFFKNILNKTEQESIEISNDLFTFFKEVKETLEAKDELLLGSISDTDRKLILDQLGTAGSAYREEIYKNGFSGDKTSLGLNEIEAFLKISLDFIEHSIEANKRPDKLYHAYNLMTVKNDSEVSISYLPEMLEGQVAVLSSGYLKTNESVTLLDALKNSALFRPDQYSYILYPNKELPRFTDKNNIPDSEVQKSELLQKLVADNNTQIVQKDCFNQYHFNGNFNNVDSLKDALNNLSDSEYKILIEKESNLIANVFEGVFNHKAFTGRSGTFFGYEGLGSIYWHMVSKLLLAVQEVSISAINNNDSKQDIGRLLDHYFEINEGIGVNKSPKLYGAFPTDPYSHTPAGKGAQQPGMTGQVKEDVLSRFGELGVFVSKGSICFNPSILRKEEFFNEAKTFHYINVKQETKTINLHKDSLAFTYCQVPIIYKKSLKESILIKFTNDRVLDSNNLVIEKEISKKMFKRTGEIESIIVHVKK
ncbi:hypothetical protein OD91_2538 [Lutibacter sp. Hel_I_33_5]|uniref:hypothetical protein n=1 Tax=Lutibacter sp. Hel_I_33_5 TaxID=1566289 RepID=UPI0011A3466E|nr:hypothetical protein [Lutibacter sp. Hel_I_33_5]TVZ57222.1 hypothetical protein OD91_2538 [Lutibacter sp. Hel_I_33_5]